MCLHGTRPLAWAPEVNYEGIYWLGSLRNGCMPQQRKGALAGVIEHTGSYPNVAGKCQPQHHESTVLSGSPYSLLSGEHRV